ncbi:XdhC family protein [Rhizobium laguerreae]|uniref:XdhC family protein n=1 Tax=Rhizobium laguerreae TaxID=1076926 RepID=UPI00144161ED|nr:XdhC family protein [Rhizobium laguerreae]MBY3321355.1 XdhC family protein [Rhizobium laguerreae]MBY3362949.1 XdhC family protein [Rhizobium laguerreae]NKM66508.1 XdhC family protein [Rhizobium laguerreae]
MNEQNATAILPATKRSMLSDDVVDILQFAVDACRDGAVALATLVEIRGGAARALGSHVVVAADGRFCGYVSGGCVEAAVASEALLAMAEGRDRTVRFGEGSPFFDLVLPCGGGITVAIHLVRNPLALHRVLESLSRRLPTALRYMPDRQMIEIADAVERAAWVGEDFMSVYRPVTRVVISGMNNEAAKLGVLARACGYDVVSVEPTTFDRSMIDPFTAVVMLHHDLDAEKEATDAALGSAAFYIGALGSSRTHRLRVERLQRRGRSSQAIERIKAPIGSFGPTKDSTSLALSVLADIAASRLATFG